MSCGTYVQTFNMVSSLLVNHWGIIMFQCRLDIWIFVSLPCEFLVGMVLDCFDNLLCSINRFLLDIYEKEPRPLPATSRSMLWQPTGASVHQPAAGLSNSVPTWRAPWGVIADCHTWQLGHRVSILDWQVLNAGSKQRSWAQQQWERAKLTCYSTTMVAVSEKLSAFESDR